MAKSKLWPKSAKDIKGKTAIAELKRAHLIIVLLSFSLLPLLAISSAAPVQLDSALSTVLSVMLAILGLISLMTIIALNKRK